MMTSGVLVATLLPLQWNAGYRTDVPYEFELVPAKIEKALGLAAGSGFGVKADGRSLEVQTFPGKAPGAVALRFRVPEGTKALVCESVGAGRAVADASRVGEEAGARRPGYEAGEEAGARRPGYEAGGEAGARRPGYETGVDSSTVDNFFAGALGEAAKWKLDGVAKTSVAGGVKLAATSAGRKFASYAVDLGRTADAAPLPVKLELDVKSVASMTWAASLVVSQFDAAGEELPELVTDGRWTTEMLPPGKAVRFREKGLVHPRARKLVFMLTMLSRDQTMDEFGLARKPGPDAWAQLELTRLALRPAAELPFPPYDAAKFFGQGVSGAAADKSLRLGREQAFWYQTRGSGSWARGLHYRHERDIFFPAGAGTVEAWFRPDWTDSGSRNFYFFEGSSHQLALQPKAVEFTGRKVLFSLRYRPETKTLAFYRKDMKDREYAGSAKADIPSGAWTHVACTFEPGAEAVVYLNGQRALAVPLKGFAALDLANDPLPNNTDVVECYVGSGHVGARVRDRIYASEPMMAGEVDLWRVSTGVRYAGAFTPAKAFSADADTRALFTFDDTFDGVSGGGIGIVPGTLRATTGRRLNRFRTDAGEVQYYPADVLAENDPDRVLDRLTYPEMPTEAEMNAARRPIRRRFRMKAGDRVSFAAGEKVYPDFVEIANRSGEPLVFPLVLNAGEVDARSFGDFAESLDAMGLTDREKVNKTFNFLLRASDYFIADSATYEPDSNVPGCVMSKALTMINGYCGFECGPLNTMAANLFACSARCPANLTMGYGHCFQQVFFDGKNHIYDLSAQRFFPSFDNETSVYLEEDEAEPGVHWRQGGSPAHFIRMGARSFCPTEPGYRPKVGVTLNPGESFRAWFDNKAAVNDLFCSPRLDKMIAGRTRNFYMPHATYERETGADAKVAKIRRMERFFPQYGNGFIEFCGRPSAANGAFVDEGATFRYRVASGYPVVAGEYVATKADGSVAPVELSFDGGETWRDFGGGELEYPVRARLAYWVRVKAALAEVAEFRATTTVQLNARIFPGRVRAGENEFRFKAVSGGVADVTVAWRENAQPIVFEGAVTTGAIPGAEKATVAFDPSEGPLAVKVTGVSPAATAEAGEGLVATLRNGDLAVSARDANKALVGYVTVRDRGAEKALTVVACPGARFVVRGAEIRAKGDRAAYGFKPVPAGDYMLMSVVRFASHPKELLGTYVSVEMDAEPKKVKNAAAAVNPHANYYKAHYGRKGGRANWKWDFTLDPATFRPYWGPLSIKVTKPLGEVTFVSPDVPPEGGAEIAAVLLLPYPDAAFRCQLEKVLCGLNACPERVQAAQARRD